MSMGEACWCNQQSPGPWLNFCPLVRELGFSTDFDVIQVAHPEQNAMQRVGGAALRIDLRVPMWITAGGLLVALQIHHSKSEAPLQESWHESGAYLSEVAVVEGYRSAGHWMTHRW